MELSTALENIRHNTDNFAEEEVLCIRDNKEEAIPVLLEIVRSAKGITDVIPDNFDDIDDPAYAMFLLAEFKVHDAFEPIISLLELDDERCDWLLGDMIADDMGSIIASVAHLEDMNRIKTVVENSGIDEFQRDAALNALLIMYLEGNYLRAEFVEYLGYLTNEYKDNEVFVTLAVCVCKDISASDIYSRVRDLFSSDKMDTTIIGAEDFAEDVPRIPEEAVINKLRADPHTCVISDTVASMKWWHCFNKEPVITVKRKIGRNAPCPCGSGKKYKHCCLNKAER